MLKRPKDHVNDQLKSELYIQTLEAALENYYYKAEQRVKKFLPFAWLLLGTVKIPSKSKIRRGIPRAAWPITGRGPHALGCNHRAKKGQILTTKIGPF